MRTVERPEVKDVSDGVVIRTEGLTKTYPTGVTAVDGLDLAVRRGRDLRPARPQRRGQDHDRRHADDPRDPDVGTSDGRRHRRRRASVDGQGRDRGRLADQHAGPEPHGLGEPLLPRPVLRDGQEGVQAHRRRDPRGLPAVRSRRRRRGDAVGRHGAAAHGRAQHLPPAADPLPGRADLRAGPAVADRAVGHHRSDPPRGADDRAHDALHGGGGPPLPAGRDHGSRASCWRSTPPTR